MFYSCKRSNGSSPHMSVFLDFWLERGVDIWDLRDIDAASERIRLPNEQQKNESHFSHDLMEK